MQLVAAITCISLFGACSDGGEDPSSSTAVVSRPAQAFSVGVVSAGYTPVATSHGRPYVPWGDDSLGTKEPFVVLAPKGSNAFSRRAVVISVTGFQGYESGLDQASPAGGPGVESHRSRIDGQRAIYVPEQVTGPPYVRRLQAELLVVRGPDLAVRVRKQGATEAELAAIERNVRPRGRSLAPSVTSTPDGYAVLGSVDAGVVTASDLDGVTASLSDPAQVRPSAGNPQAWLSTWSAPGAPADGLAVTTLPARAGSLEALPASSAISGAEHSARWIDVGGRRGVLTEDRVKGSNAGDASAPVVFTKRVVYSDPGWGNLVVVVAWGRAAVPSADVLAKTAASVARAGG